ncbi:MAG: hypothetical protein JNM18_17525 [Planctomycetaceae bacterium]|nr:hypothetical protein [Planctomycetaceae bacterium]
MNSKPTTPGLTVGEFLKLLAQEPGENELIFGGAGLLSLYRIVTKGKSTCIEFNEVESLQIKIHQPE